jgi:radical SAM-linked protein
MAKIRLRYSKKGRARYISHLDLMATMRRALLRAGVRLKYSEGFNPHPYASVALPLSVGYESVCELIDIGTEVELVPDGLPEQINPVLPEGLEIVEAYSPARKFSDIAWTEISGLLGYDTGAVQCVEERLAERYAAASIVVSKKTKRGISNIDIAPFVRDIEFVRGDTVAMRVKLSAQNPSISPENLMSALAGGHEEFAPDFTLFTRIGVYDKEMKVFR